jgi:hypothetical protein
MANVSFFSSSSGDIDLSSLEKSGILDNPELQRLLSPSLRNLLAGKLASKPPSTEDEVSRRMPWMTLLSNNRRNPPELEMPSPSRVRPLLSARSISEPSEPAAQLLKTAWTAASPLPSPLPKEQEEKTGKTEDPALRSPSTPEAPENSKTVETEEKDSKPIFVTTSNIGDILSEYDKKHKKS